MSGLWFKQRGALEKVVDWQNPFPVKITSDRKLVLESGEPLFVLGPSEGVGTCSAPQYHGFYILVLGLDDPGDGRTSRLRHLSDPTHLG